MPLIYLGSVDAASDATMATVANNVSSQFRGALSTLISAVIAQNPTVIAAAEAAVAAAVPPIAEAAVASAIVREDLLKGAERRSPREGNVKNFRIRDDAGMVAVEIRETGTAWAADMEIDQLRVKNLTVQSGSGAAARCVVMPYLGQSNQLSHAQPIVPLLDGETGRTWQLPDGGTSLVPATVPLTAPGGTATGLSPSHALAREIVRNDPDVVVVLVPVAKGGSGLVTDTQYGAWAIDYAGAGQKLYQNAVTMMTLALSLVTSRWNITPTVITTWLQGEADGADGITRAAYQAALDALITDWLSRFGGSFLLAGIVPQAATSGTRPEIVRALRDTPRRITRTAYVEGVDNGGGSRGPDDVIHYGREAVEIIGARWFRAIPCASNNLGSSRTTPPVTVSAYRWLDTVTVEWSFPYCRVTAFEVQYSTDGTTWVDVPVTEPVATSVTFTSAVPVRVRVRAVGPDVSNWTRSVVALAA